MKKKNLKGIKVFPLVIVLFILIPLFGSAAASSEVSISHSTISDMQLLQPGTGWILVAGEIFWTEDNGIQWENISPNNGSVTAVHFISPTSGFSTTRISKINGIVTIALNKTIDHGQTWESTEIANFSIDNPLAASQSMFVFFLDNLTGWVALKQQSSSNFNIGTLFRTTDGGDSWEELSIPIGERVLFINESIGFTSGGLYDHLLYRTEDGGISWTPFDPSPSNIAKMALPTFITPDYGVAINFVDASKIQILETDNRGSTWKNTSALDIDSTSLELHPTISFADKSSIFTPTEQIVFDSVTNTFTSTPISLPGILTKIDGFSPEYLWGVATESYCDDPNNPGTCGNFDELVYSVDEGITWTAISTPVVQQNLDNLASFDLQPQANVIDYPRTSILRGQGFDICEIPTYAQLDNWMTNSPYAAVNLYIGGVSRACPNTSLTLPGGDLFLQALSIQGWKFIPTWVGHQAYCTTLSYKMSSNLETARQQGRDNATEAMRTARKLGLGAEDNSGTVIYYDLEGFDTSNTTCLSVAKAFIDGWVSELHLYDILAGLYGSACASALSSFSTINNPPDVIWPAAWYSPYAYTSDASTLGVPCVSNSLWDDQERIRQYAGGHDEYWGGIGLNIDSNVIDGVVADISRFVGVPSSTLQNPSFETGTLSPWAVNLNNSACSWAIPNTGDAHTGDYALSISKSAAQTNCTGVSQALTLSPSIGDYYRFAVWARSTSPSDYRSLRLKISGTGGAEESSNQKYSGIDDTWQCLEVGHTIQNTNLDQLIAEVLAEDTDGIEILLDDAHMSLNTASLCPTMLLPTNLQASNAQYFNQVKLIWDQVPDATYYRIFRSNSESGDKFLIGQSLTNDFSDVDGNPVDLYYYWVKACNAGKCSTFSDFDTGSFGPATLNFYDGFESGDFVYWPTIANPGAIFACNTTKITGSYSVCAEVNTPNAATISQPFVTDTNRISVSFDFDPNDAALSNRVYTIMQAPTATGIAFQLKLKYTAPNYQVWLEWYSGGNIVSSSFVNIPNAPAHYQIDWNSSAVQGRSINTFRKLKLSINNVAKISVQDIDNRGTLVNSLLFGIIPSSTTTTQTNGIILFDNISFFGPQYLR